MNYKFLFPFFALAVSAFADVGVFNNTGSLATARSYHTATLLPNGEVLVAGGYDGNSYPASTELYDPASGTWAATGSLASARAGHTATLLPNGKVLVAGGFNNSGYPASAELYDPASGTWTGTGSLNPARAGHTATLLPNGKVLVAGGQGEAGQGSNSYLASAELYDPALGTWTATGSLASARYFPTATLLPNGKVLVAGGYNDTSGYLSSAELYDPTSGTWTVTGNMNSARERHTATLLPNGRVLVAAGFTANNTASASVSTELYDPASGTWTGTGSLNTARSAHTATLLPSSKVLVAAGVDNNSNVLASAELYTPTPTHVALLNISTRAHVGTGSDVLIAGFIVGGNGSASSRVVVRAIGPSLSTFGITGTLQDPTLEIHDGTGALIASNNDWKTSQQAAITATGLAPTNDKESAILITLGAGQYTAVVKGNGGTQGVAVVEAYILD